MKEKKYKDCCTEETVGMVQSIKVRGMDCPTEIVVSYTVNSERYMLTDTIKYRKEAIKIGFLPVGQRRIARLGEVYVGATLRVAYNPEEPEQSRSFAVTFV